MLMHSVRHFGGQQRASVSGFTLIELLVTITLLGILVTLSIPSFTGWIRNSQIRTVADALQTGVRTAQAESVRRNRQVVMWFTNGDPLAGGTPLAGGKNWGLQTVAQFGETAEYITGGKLADIASSVAIANDMASNAICFNSVGRMVANPSSTGISGAGCQLPTAPTTGTNFNITLAGADRPLRVIVQLGGQLRMCDPNRPTMSSASPDGCP